MTTAALVVLLCVRNRFLFSTRLYEDADMGANSILVEQARHFTLLIGNYSRDHFHHPGPAYMYVMAAGESLFWAWLHVVPTAWNGQLLAVYALNSLFVGLVVGVGYGWTRSLPGAAACFAAVLALAACTRPCSARTGCRTCTCSRTLASWSRQRRWRRGVGGTRGPWR